MKKNLFFMRWKPYGLKQTLRIMKLTVFMLVIGFLQLSAKTFSQTENLSLQMKNVSIQELFKVIESQSDVKFFYQDEQLMDANEISVDVSGKNLDEVLTEVLKDTNLSYRVLENHVIIFETKAKIEGASAVSTQQQHQITGKVIDKNGEPLPGVNVYEKETTNGVITGIDGNFTINVSSPDAVIVFSFIGFVTQEVNVASRTHLDITLVEEMTGLDEVVVVGYSAQKKVNVTGAVASVTGDELLKRPVVNASQALQGAATGVTIIDRGGEPGKDTPTIIMRGMGTTGDSRPLVLVDGIEMSMNDVNPNDIESVSFLKDAASGAIYGSRAANGVVLITTKRGKEGRFTVDYNGYVGVQAAASLPESVGPRDYMTLVNESRANAGQDPKYTETDIVRTENGELPFTDWFEEMYKPTYITDHSLRLSGGSDVAKASLSLGYTDQPGLLKNIEFQRYNLRFNGDFQIAKKLSLAFTTAYTRKDRSYPHDLGGAKGAIVGSTPAMGIKDENGLYILNKDKTNALAALEVSGTDTHQDEEALFNLRADWDVFTGMKLSGEAALNTNAYRKKSFKAYHEFRDAEGNILHTWQPSNVQDERWNENQLTLRAFANYSKSLADVHNINVLVGVEQISSDEYYVGARRDELLTNNLPELNIGSAESQFAWGGPSSYGLNSFFGRINYDYKGKYLFEANARYDGSSHFSEGNKWGFFPSFSAGWRLSEEAFLAGADFLDNLKLRGSWGQIGNERIGSFKYTNTFASFWVDDWGGTNFFDYIFNDQLTTGYAQKQYANKDITWETAEVLDFGVEASFFNQKIGFEADYYRRDQKDILLKLPIPMFIGLDAAEDNIGTVRNEGVELGINHQNNINGFKYGINVKWSYNNNEWVKLGEYDRTVDGWKIQSKGSPLNAFYLYQADGFFQNQAEIVAYPGDTRSKSVLQPGDIKFKDTDGDGDIDEDDRVIKGSNYPSQLLSITGNASYKGFDLSFMLQGAFDVKNYYYGELQEGPNYEVFTSTRVLGRWQKEGDTNATFPRLEASTNKNQNPNNTFWLRDASYLRLKNIQIGYTLPKTLTSQAGIERLRVYVGGSNVFTITDVDKGVDPESYDGRIGGYPPVSVYSVGVNVQF